MESSLYLTISAFKKFNVGPRNWLKEQNPCSTNVRTGVSMPPAYINTGGYGRLYLTLALREVRNRICESGMASYNDNLSGFQ